MSLAEVVNWEFWSFGSKQPMSMDGHFLVIGSFDGEAAHQLVEMVQREWVVVGRGELHGHGIEGWVMRTPH